MFITMYELEKNLIAQKIEEIEDKNLKGHRRQVEILKFLGLFKYSLIEHLEFLTGTKNRNIYKNINKLEKLEYIQKDIHSSYRIVSITEKALELLAIKNNIQIEILKTKEKFKKELSFLEHELEIRKLAIRLISENQIVLPISIFLKFLHRNGIDRKQINKVHRADLILLKYDKEYEDIFIIGVEFENKFKKREQYKRKFQSMDKSLGHFYNGYFIVAKSKVILERIKENLEEYSKKDRNARLFRLATNLSNNNFLDVEQLIEIKEETKEAVNQMYKTFKNYYEIEEIKELKRKLYKKKGKKKEKIEI